MAETERYGPFARGRPPGSASTYLIITRTGFPARTSETVRMDKPLKEMTPEELAFADAYLVRRINRAQRIATARTLTESP